VCIGEQNPGSPKVWETYNALIGKFGSEYSVMLDVPEAQLVQAAGAELSQAILKVRRDEVFVEPGYDGVYGRIDLAKNRPVKRAPSSVGLEQFV